LAATRGQPLAFMSLASMILLLMKSLLDVILPRSSGLCL